MKKALLILGAFFGVLVIVAVVGIAFLAIQGSALDEDSKAYVDEVTPVILADLKKETLFLYASDDLIKSATPAEFDKIFDWFGKLGKFKRYNGSEGQATISMTTQQGRQVNGIYVAKADFENGPATVKVTVVQKDDTWKVIGFHINSMALAN